MTATLNEAFTNYSGMNARNWLFNGVQIQNGTSEVYFRIYDENDDPVVEPASGGRYVGGILTAELLTLENNETYIAPSVAGFYVANLPQCNVGRVVIEQFPSDSVLFDYSFDPPLAVSDTGMIGWAQSDFSLTLEGRFGCIISQYASNQIINSFLNAEDTESRNEVTAGLDERWIGLIDDVGNEVPIARENFLAVFNANLVVTEGARVIFDSITPGTVVTGWAIFDGATEFDEELIRGDFFLPMTISTGSTITIEAGDFYAPLDGEFEVS